MSYNPYFHYPGYIQQPPLMPPTMPPTMPPIQYPQNPMNLYNKKESNNNLLIIIFIFSLILLVYGLYYFGFISDLNPNFKNKLKEYFDNLDAGPFLEFYHIGNKHLSYLTNIEDELDLTIEQINYKIENNPKMTQYKNYLINKKYNESIKIWKERRMNLFFNKSDSCNYLTRNDKWYNSSNNIQEIKAQNISDVNNFITLNTKPKLNKLNDPIFLDKLKEKQNVCSIQFKNNIHDFISNYSCNNIDNINEDQEYNNIINKKNNDIKNWHELINNDVKAYSDLELNLIIDTTKNKCQKNINLDDISDDFSEYTKTDKIPYNILRSPTPAPNNDLKKPTSN